MYYEYLSYVYQFTLKYFQISMRVGINLLLTGLKFCETGFDWINISNGDCKWYCKNLGLFCLTFHKKKNYFFILFHKNFSSSFC